MLQIVRLKSLLNGPIIFIKNLFETFCYLAGAFCRHLLVVSKTSCWFSFLEQILFKQETLKMFTVFDNSIPMSNFDGLRHKCTLYTTCRSAPRIETMNTTEFHIPRFNNATSPMFSYNFYHGWKASFVVAWYFFKSWK